MADDAKDYKSTLNLPQTDFPMRGNLPNKEPEIIQFWDDSKVYHTLRERRAGKPKFILHDGPPYANGAIHIGHAVNKVLKDIIVKSKGLMDYDAPYIPGWDCHGLPIELNVEKKHGKAGDKLDAKAFRDKAREYAQSQIDGQREDFIRLGIMGEWQDPYKTMDFQTEADTIRALGKIIENGHLQRGEKPVHWCVDCGSALAEAEVEYQDKDSFAIDVVFPVVDPDAFAKAFGVGALDNAGLVIWTTTPWTLPANQAVSLHPDFNYALVQTDNQQLIIAESLVDAVLERGKLSGKTIATCAGSALENLELKHPFYQRTSLLILGDHVTLDSGTGAVHTAPAHGQDDFKVGQKYNLGINNPVLASGVFKDDTEFFAGEFVFKANEHIVEVLKEHQALLCVETLNHSYPHCWRHKSPIIFRATSQWFIAMDKNNLRDQAMKNIQQVQWVPDWGQARIESMIENRPDWCISRQRMWNSPITLFVHKETAELHPDTPAIIEKVAKLVENKGIDGWFAASTEELLGAEAKDYDKITDTLDVWFDSGVTHFSVLNSREELTNPADLYLEGSDQHRGWFQSSLLTSVAMTGGAPYKAVLTHGFVVDAKGNKMSKSIGNVISPQKVIQQMGADIIRLWISSADYRGEMAASNDIFKHTGEAYRRIRNTARFLLSNLSGFNPEKDSVSQLVALDAWVIAKTARLQQEIIAAYNDYTFHLVFQKIHHFCSITLGSFYLDIIKDRQYTTQANSLARRSTQTAMYHIIEAMTRWLAPIVSFTAEEIYKHIPGNNQESVFLQTFYTGFPELTDTDKDEAFWQQILEVRLATSKVLENLRAEGKIGSSLDAEVILYADDALLATVDKLKDELRFVLITSAATAAPLAQATDEAVHTDIEGLHIHATSSTHNKCERCWHHREEVGSHTDHPTLCGRCIENVEGAGEERHYA